MTVAHPLLPALAAVLLACLASAQEGRVDPRPPNVVLIVVDDPGYADFGPEPAGGFEIPHMRSIAAQGVRFTRAYSCASICSPARAGLLTGRYPQRFGFEYNPPHAPTDLHGLTPRETTLAEALRARGYRTAAVGKWHLGLAERSDPLGAGFDEFWGFLAGSRRYFKLHERRWNRANRIRDGRDPVPEEDWYLTEEFGREAVEAIERHREHPFFLYLSFSAVHGPMHATEEALARVSGIEDEDRRRLAAMTLSLDEAVGRVLSALERLELDDRTLVVLTGDHGGSQENHADNAPLRGLKGGFFEGGVRVPLFVRWPGRITAGSVHGGAVSTLDLFPTLLAAAGGDPGELERVLDGVDLAPLLAGQGAPPSHPVLYWRRGEDWAVRRGDWKLVRHEPAAPMLFRLDEDPFEERDLSARFPQRVGELQAAWSAWSAELMAPSWIRYRDDDD